MRGSDRTLVKTYALEHGIDFRTVSRARKSPRRFYILRTVLEGLKADEPVIVSDIFCFAKLCLRGLDGTLRIDFTWLNGGYDRLTGWEESVTLPYGTLMDFVHESSQKGGPKEWRYLSLRTGVRPRIVLYDQEGLRKCLGTKPSGESWPGRCGTIFTIPMWRRSAFTMTSRRTPSCFKKSGPDGQALRAV